MTNKNVKSDTNSTETVQTASPRPKKKHRAARIAFIAIVHALGVGAIVGLSVALYYSEDKIEMQASYQREMESAYSRSYYDLVDSANDLDVTMAKLSAASTAEKQQALYYELWGAAALAADNLSAFENTDEGVRSAVKFVNQLGDYSLFLAKKIGSGERVTAEEKALLAELKPVTAALKNSLSSVQSELDSGKLFVGDEGVLTSFSSSFSEFTEPGADYPEMIYDGPFSDALDVREAKALAGEAEVNETACRAKLLEYFPSAAEVEYIGRFEGRIPAHNYSFLLDGAPAYAQLSDRGGRLLNFTSSAGKGGESADAERLAEEFASRLGYDNLQTVWSTQANGAYFVNLAPVENGIILYPDLVKVKLSGGKVVGFDSTHHAYNHVKRDLPAPVISETAARAKLALEPVSAGRLALIPGGGTKETLCYEYRCEEGGIYYVYIDAATGGEADILYVIDSEQGTVLM